MKPVRITAENFRSYATLELDLEGVRAATLSGPNGAGKSSILSAMLFALYGPQGGISADDYVKRGASAGGVRFTFDLAGRRYRVTRSRDINGRGKSSLEFAIEDGGAWQSLSGDTAKQTQAVIVNTLRLDLDGFLKSAWIAQGAADAFTGAGPTERKKVLAGVLDLGAYAKLHTAAKDHLATRVREIDTLSGRLESVEAELATRGALEHDTASALERVDNLAAYVKTAEATVADLTEKDKAGAAAWAKRDALADKARDLENLADNLAERIRAAKENRGALLGERDALPQLRADLEGKPALEVIVSNFEKERDAYQAHRLEIERLGAEARRTRDALDAATAQARGAEEVVAEARRDLARAQDIAADAINAAADLKLAEAPVCETCGQDVQGASFEQALAAAEAKADAGRVDVEQRREYLAAAEAAAKTVAGNVEETRRYASEADGALNAAPVFVYDEAGHRAAIDAVAALADHAARIARAEAAEQKAADLTAELETMAADAAKARGGLTEARDALNAMAETLNSVERVAEDLSHARCDLDSARQQLADAQERKTRAASGLERLDKLQADTAGDRERWTAAQSEADVWRDLAGALGRDGIPALIIDAAIPEVEATANALLEGLGGGLRVSLETQKALKTSDRIAETLDVIITDGGVARPYETYSGGEAYRVNVALRVALSKLLTARAGAQVDALILDEPEGLDADGREKLIALLTSLGSTFETILLITHHEDLAGAFPARIECSKGPEGSEAILVMGA